MTQVCWTQGTKPCGTGWNVETKKVRDNWQVEIRRSFERAGQLLVIVGLDGYNYGMSDTIDNVRGNRWHKSTKGYNVRISSNQAIDMTWQDWSDLKYLIFKAKELLEGFKHE